MRLAVVDLQGPQHGHMKQNAVLHATETLVAVFVEQVRLGLWTFGLGNARRILMQIVDGRLSPAERANRSADHKLYAYHQGQDSDT